MTEQNAVTELRTLQAQQDEINSRIGAVRAAAQAQLRASLEAQAKDAGTSIYEMYGIKPPRKPRKASAPWYDPNDKTKVWVGSGKRPGWIQALLANGFTPEQLQTA